MMLKAAICACNGTLMVESIQTTKSSFVESELLLKSNLNLKLFLHFTFHKLQSE